MALLNIADTFEVFVTLIVKFAFRIEIDTPVAVAVKIKVTKTMVMEIPSMSTEMPVDFVDLQRRAEMLKAKRDKAVGALESELARLKTEYKLKSVEEARLFIAQASAQIEATEERIQKMTNELDLEIAKIEEAL